MMNACVMQQCVKDLAQQQCRAAYVQAIYATIAESWFTAEELFSCHPPDLPCAASSAQEQHSSCQADGPAHTAAVLPCIASQNHVGSTMFAVINLVLALTNTRESLTVPTLSCASRHVHCLCGARVERRCLANLTAVPLLRRCR